MILLASMVGLFGCNGQTPPSKKSSAVGVRDVAGGPQSDNPTPENFGQRFALREVEPLAIDRKLFGAITRFDPNEGVAVLSDGRCLQLRQGRSVSGRSTDAIISAGDARCKALTPAAEGRVSLPCHLSRLSELVGIGGFDARF